MTYWYTFYTNLDLQMTIVYILH